MTNIDRILFVLGCINTAGKPTTIGHEVAKLPSGFSGDAIENLMFSRMIIEARRLGVIDEIMTVIALMKQRGSLVTACKDCREWHLKGCMHWRDDIDEQASDIMAMLMVYQKAKRVPSRELKYHNINFTTYQRIENGRKALYKLLGARPSLPSGSREDILHAVYSGMIIYLRTLNKWYDAYERTEGIPDARWLLHSSVVQKDTSLVIAQPFTLRREGAVTQTVPLLRLVNAVDIDSLMEVAPHLRAVRKGLRPRLQDGQVVSTTETRYYGLLVDTEEIPDPRNPLAPQIILNERNKEQWHTWLREGNRPVILLPTKPYDDQMQVIAYTYAHDDQTSRPLRAYGTIATEEKYGRFDFKVLWTRDLHEAGIAKDNTNRYLHRLRKELANDKRREAAEEERNRLLANEVSLVCEQAQRLTEDMRLSEEVRHELAPTITPPTYIQNVTELRQWLTEAEARVDSAEEILSQAISEAADQALLVLMREARQLRDEVNELICDCPSSAIKLAAYDIEDSQLPQGAAGLKHWIKSARVAMNKVRHSRE